VIGHRRQATPPSVSPRDLAPVAPSQPVRASIAVDDDHACAVEKNKRRFNARKVSGRQHHSTLYITLRDASASLSRVTEIAGQFEQVRRDHATGEILCGGNTFVRVEYADALVDPIKAEILAVLDPAPNDEYIALPGGFRACKVSSQHGAITYVREVRMEGPTFHYRNNIAVGVSWAAERLAVARLDASALAQGAASIS
jgi:hypothetical protein